MFENFRKYARFTDRARKVMSPTCCNKIDNTSLAPNIGTKRA
jgi:hypothetical protein